MKRNEVYRKVFLQKNKRSAQRDAQFKKFFPQGETGDGAFWLRAFGEEVRCCKNFACHVRLCTLLSLNFFAPASSSKIARQNSIHNVFFFGAFLRRRK
ncbi:MAG: hypothetical protein IKO42_01790 [Opitutales bacterium]|nr:hypothetical protein [Opitutales bacterium]